MWYFLHAFLPTYIDTTVVRIIVSKLYLLLVVVGVTLQLTAHLHNRTTADQDG